MQPYLLYFAIRETDLALGRAHVDRPAEQSHQAPAGMRRMHPPNPPKQTLVPGPSGAARSRPGGGGAVLEHLSGRAVQQPSGTQLRAVLPPSRNASCAQVSEADAPAPAQAPPPNGDLLRRGSRPLTRPRLSSPDRVPPPEPANRRAAVDLERPAWVARDLERSLLPTFLPDSQLQ